MWITSNLINTFIIDKRDKIRADLRRGSTAQFVPEPVRRWIDNKKKHDKPIQRINLKSIQQDPWIGIYKEMDAMKIQINMLTGIVQTLIHHIPAEADPLPLPHHDTPPSPPPHNNTSPADPDATAIPTTAQHHAVEETEWEILE